MDEKLLERVALYAPSWVRYVLTTCEIARTGYGWVVSSGDDIAIMDAGGMSAMPLWPYELPAAIAAEGDAVAERMGARELIESIMRSLAENKIGVVAFPGQADAVVTAEAVARDIVDFTQTSRDVAAELATGPRPVPLSGAVLLETPDMGELASSEAPRFWLLVADDAKGVYGVDTPDGAALALFATAMAAEAFASREDVVDAGNATVIGADAEALMSRWLLLAFSAEWNVAIVGDDDAGLAPAVRLALDVAEEAVHSAGGSTAVAGEGESGVEAEEQPGADAPVAADDEPGIAGS